MTRTPKIILSLGSLSKKWLHKDFVFRKKATRELVRSSGFSKKMAQEHIDALFSELTAPKLFKLLKNELRDPSALSGFARENDNRRSVRAQGPETILHIFSATTPAAAVMSFVLGLLIGSRNIGKLSSRDEGFLGTYLRSLKAHDQPLGRRCRLIPSNDRSKVRDLSKRAGLVVAYGNDETLESIRKEVPVSTPFVGYGHRVSFSLYCKEALSQENAGRLAKKTALDVWMLDQRGCLSPVIVFAQKKGEVSAERFAGMVAREMGRLEAAEVSKPKRSLRDWLAAAKLRDRSRLAALGNQKSKIWESRIKGLWMVAYDEKQDMFFLGGSQTLRVKGFNRFKDLEGNLKQLRAVLQAAALECVPAERRKIAEWLSSFGVNRICRAGMLQYPPVTWHHDGRPNLADWLRWTDLED